VIDLVDVIVQLCEILDLDLDLDLMWAADRGAFGIWYRTIVKNIRAYKRNTEAAYAFWISFFGMCFSNESITNDNERMACCCRNTTTLQRQWLFDHDNGSTQLWHDPFSKFAGLGQQCGFVEKTPTQPYDSLQHVEEVWVGAWIQSS
jgi:hypothetical protein